MNIVVVLLYANVLWFDIRVEVTLSAVLLLHAGSASKRTTQELCTSFTNNPQNRPSIHFKVALYQYYLQKNFF